MVLLLLVAADGDPYEKGRDAEARLDFSEALADYEQSLERFPNGRWALAAKARADDLKAHAEGNFGPLVTLEKARRGPQTSEAIDALVRDADGFPNGPVRAEARMLAAESYLARLDRPADGKKMLQLVLDDASADSTVRQFAARRLADLAMAEGLPDDARVAARTADDPSLEKKITRTVRRRMARKMASGAVAITLVLALVALVRGRNRGARVARAVVARARTVAIFSAIAAGGGILASSYERGHALPFVVLAGCIAVLATIAVAWSEVGSNARWARIGRSIACGAAALGIGFLVLDRIDASYLEGFGL